MITFFAKDDFKIYLVSSLHTISSTDIEKLVWLFGGAIKLDAQVLEGTYVGPKRSMVTPWSTNAVEITQNMGIHGIDRIEEFSLILDSTKFDPLTEQKYEGLNQDIFDLVRNPEPIKYVDDIAAYNIQEGLSLNDEEIKYLENLSKKTGRLLTDSEIFGFSQVNSEHCRHKIFNGQFIIDGQTQSETLFSMIKKTSTVHPNEIVSAYKDNVAFIEGPNIKHLAPIKGDKPSEYEISEFESVLSLKAETHNFPTTVEPFNGAATGTGGEIRDRMAGGRGSIPLAGTAVYMTPYSRSVNGKQWEEHIEPRKWLYQTPIDILIKASNGASDFGNKFGQPLITGSLFTFEHDENDVITAYDKVIMLAGGIGFGKKDQSKKEIPEKSDKIVILGGDNYRIGMGGAAVSSADTGSIESGIELNAVQRSNPEMQRRVANTVRATVEGKENPVVSIHDHGAGGHLNCLSELVEDTGGVIDIDSLPIGDKSLSAREIIGNESQERMGLVVSEKGISLIEKIAARERAPFYQVGEITMDNNFSFYRSSDYSKPVDLAIADLLGSTPKTIIRDNRIKREFGELKYDVNKLEYYLAQVLQLEAVACKDWLTNKVDRCVSGRVAKQQCTGPLQLPLNNCGVVALDFENRNGIATSIGHSPISAIIDSGAGSRNSIAEALTNIIWAPLDKGIKSISLSANWMWPGKNPGEDARLYDAVRACSDFAIALGINIPTGKDSLSMTQKYSDREVQAPGTVIISATGLCTDITSVIEPNALVGEGSLYYLGMSYSDFELGGSSFSQILGEIGNSCPDIKSSENFIAAFNFIQDAIKKGYISAGHDVGSGGLITTLLEMCFATPDTTLDVDLTTLDCDDSIRLLFSENAGVVIQIVNKCEADFERFAQNAGVEMVKIGSVNTGNDIIIKNGIDTFNLNVADYRDIWYKTSYLLDIHQAGAEKAKERYDNYKYQPLKYVFPAGFIGKRPEKPQKRIKAAVIREKGSNSEREMANAMYQAGFEVIDVHMTDLISGRETLEDVRFIGAVGGFSNSDVLGSAKGWAGAFKYNEKAKQSLMKFFNRQDTLSVGICNGCQLFMELDLICPDSPNRAYMDFNDSHKYESVFTSLSIQKSNSVMLSSLEGSNLGVWVSHGEGKFILPGDESHYNIVAKYAYDNYPASPNGSDFNTAVLCSNDGRHLVTMPHIERSIFSWNWPYLPKELKKEMSPWIEAYINARKWLEKTQR